MSGGFWLGEVLYVCSVSKSTDKKTAWPFTYQIETTAKWMRRIKAYSVLGGGLLLVVGVIASLF